MSSTVSVTTPRPFLLVGRLPSKRTREATLSPTSRGFQEADLVPAERGDRGGLVDAELGLEAFHEREPVEAVGDAAGKAHLAGERIIGVQRVVIVGEIAEPLHVVDSDGVPARLDRRAELDVLVVRGLPGASGSH